MDILTKEWIDIAEKYCEHYEVDGENYGEIKRLKKDAPNNVKEIYKKQLLIWKKKGYELPEDADDFL